VVASGGALEREASSSKLWVTAPSAKQSTEVLELRKRNAALEAELSSLASSLSGRAMAAVVTDRVEHICEKNQHLKQSKIQKTRQRSSRKSKRLVPSASPWCF
jgi:hypothetical protein